MKTSIVDNINVYSLKNFDLKTLTLSSRVLQKNPLRDPIVRHFPIVIPKGDVESLPVVMVLAGFTGVGSKYLNLKFQESNFVQVLDRCFGEGKAPRALFVLVDAMTFWGGSQFINSKGTGPYEDLIVKELYSNIVLNFSVSKNAKHWCLMGGSSGGYGGLHLSSKYPGLFGLVAAIAPDSFFDQSLLPEIFKAAPTLLNLDGVKGVKKEILEGRFFKRRESHTILNAIGMGTCYAPDKKNKGEVLWPIDLETGIVKKAVWEKWKKYDPIQFLKERRLKVKKISGMHLKVGTKDQYNLQFGCRQLRKIVEPLISDFSYSEFNGNHFDISSYRPEVYQWLKERWG